MTIPKQRNVPMAVPKALYDACKEVRIVLNGCVDDSKHNERYRNVPMNVRKVETFLLPSRLRHAL